jgi:hypothetical protein
VLTSCTEPGLNALHSAAVGSLVELLVVTGVGLNKLGRNVLAESTDLPEAKNNMIGNTIKALLTKPFETAYVVRKGLFWLL